MTQVDKLYIKSTASELVNEIGKLYSKGDGEKNTPFGLYKLPNELYKYKDKIAKIYRLADILKVDLEDKL